MYGANSSIVVVMLTPLALRVISRIRRLNRSRDFGAIMRLMSGPAVKPNPRNFRSCGRATALFASFTLSLSFTVMKRVTLSGIEECPGELQQPLVLDPLGDLAHQFVMIDSIEELLQ